MSEKPYVVVVGGANVDIAGRPAGPLVPYDSNLGTVRMSHGGVGRNIAHNLALLGADVRLVTAFGDDAAAGDLRLGCVAAGVSVSSSITVPGGATSTYLFVMDEEGEMQVAINDMAILDELTPERLAERRELLQGAAVCLVDTNIPEASIRWLAEELAGSVPLFCDPISTVKAEKVSDVLGSIHTLKPNKLEAASLSGIDTSDEWGVSHACDALLATGLERAFVSLGADGLLCADAGHSVRLPLVPSNVVNTTGAGDAMMAGLIWAYLHGFDLDESGLAGLAASSIAVESAQTVNPLMSEALLVERMRTHA